MNRFFFWEEDYVYSVVLSTLQKKVRAYYSTLQTINNLHESTAPGYKSRESKEQWHFRNNLIKVTFIQGCK